MGNGKRSYPDLTYHVGAIQPVNAEHPDCGASENIVFEVG